MRRAAARAGRRGLALALAALGLAGPAAARAPSRAELERLQRAIAERRERVAAFEREQRGLLDALEAVDRAAAEIDSQRARWEREAREAEAAQRAAEAQLPPLEAALAATRRAMAARVVALYKTGELGPAQLLFAAQSVRELLERVDALSVLLAHDRRLVARYRAEQATLQAARQAAADTAERRRAAIAAAGEREADLEREREAKVKLLAAVRSDRARERAALAELEAAARALEETLAKLGDAPEALPAPPGTPFAALRGRLPRPVDAPIVRGFGREVDAQFHTQVFRKGVDFGAARGDEVRAVAAGRVRFAGWFRGYGRMVIVDHGDRFYSVSGHLDELRVAVGDEVEAGAVIGTVGDTGSLSGPRLYFEIRQGAEAVDPERWLAAG